MARVDIVNGEGQAQLLAHTETGESLAIMAEEGIGVSLEFRNRNNRPVIFQIGCFDDEVSLRIPIPGEPDRVISLRQLLYVVPASEKTTNGR